MASSQDLDQSKWNDILHGFVTPQSRVDYNRLKLERVGALNSYLDQLAQPWPQNMAPDAVKAALINSYNALTVRWILVNYPVQSIWRTDDPFRVPRHRLDARNTSLDEIETRLRNMDDPRIHGALVCAARSCPPLRREAYSAAELNSQLDDNFRLWLADSSRNQFLPERKLARVSKVFDWYAGDFERSGGVPSYLARFAPTGAFAADFPIEYQDYNWGLNDTGSTGDGYTTLKFSVDWVRNGYLWAEIRNWFFGLGERYGVNPLVFGSIYVGAIPFFSLSIAWLVRNVRRRRSPVVPILCASFCFVSAYLYLLFAGKNLPVWVYLFIFGMITFGAWSAFRKVKSRLGTGDPTS
jgi:hypothetical protein